MAPFPFHGNEKQRLRFSWALAVAGDTFASQGTMEVLGAEMAQRLEESGHLHSTGTHELWFWGGCCSVLGGPQPSGSLAFQVFGGFGGGSI